MNNEQRPGRLDGIIGWFRWQLGEADGHHREQVKAAEEALREGKFPRNPPPEDLISLQNSGGQEESTT